MKYYLIAGERSGDLHASNLVEALKQQDPSGSFRGIGGNYMLQSGVELYADYRDMAVMGIVDVLKNLLKFRALLKGCASDIIHFGADVVILIDFAGFNLRMARIIKKQQIKVFYYISPKIWAWNQKRAYKVRDYVDHMFTILPFEQEFYRKFGVETHYVGNPVVDAVKKFKEAPFHDKHELAQSQTLIALLPGSRKHEIRATLPMMAALARLHPQYTFGVSVVSNVPEAFYQVARDLPNIRLVPEDNYNLLANAQCAIVASGTATLETALLGVPQVVVYKVGRLNWFIGKILVHVKYISLVNLIMDKPVVRELLQKDFTLENLDEEFLQLTKNQEYINNMKEDYQQLRQMLGDQHTSMKAATMMVDILKGYI
jgi:lipid-A-disaccharide synthase